MEYACYKDDEFICIGTLKEIAEYLGVSLGTVKSYKARFNTGSRKSPYIFIEVEYE
jgi:hypothetical protein